jgi:outer membrane murein-binding lipoprotein Lpp
MSAQEWEIVVGVVMAAILAAGPWMFMVHAKLAVLSAQVARLETKVDRVFDAQQERLPQCIQHETALKELERRWEMLALRE